MTVMHKAICSYLYSAFNHTVCLFVSLTFLLLYLFLLCSIKMFRTYIFSSPNRPRDLSILCRIDTWCAWLHGFQCPYCKRWTKQKKNPWTPVLFINAKEVVLKGFLKGRTMIQKTYNCQACPSHTLLSDVNHNASLGYCHFFDKH